MLLQRRAATVQSVVGQTWSCKSAKTTEIRRPSKEGIPCWYKTVGTDSMTYAENEGSNGSDLRHEETPWRTVEPVDNKVWSPWLESAGRKSQRGSKTRKKRSRSFFKGEGRQWREKKPWIFYGQGVQSHTPGDTVEFIRKPIGHGRVKFLIVLSAACWWRGPPKPARHHLRVIIL